MNRFPCNLGAMRFPVSILLLALSIVRADMLLIPMDLTQTNHLKAYGAAYRAVNGGLTVEWLLNYRGGSFLMPPTTELRLWAAERGILFEVIGDSRVDALFTEMEASNMERVILEKAPQIAVYTPLTKQPWDDAVTLALSYAEIPYSKIYDREILEGELGRYDWLHLHHEDFTGQNSKFHAAFSNAPWYINQSATNQRQAEELGLRNNVQLKKAVVLALRDYVENGGFLFAMCLACTTLDIALSTVKTDAVGAIFDGTPPAPDFRDKMDYSLALAFENFDVDPDPMSSTHGDLDYNQVNAGPLLRRPANDFILFDFSPKYDPVPSMLVQNHTDHVKGFFGLATSFRKKYVKSSMTILAEVDGQDAVRYLHGNLGRGQFTYYGGHDPEDYSHAVGDAPTDLDLHRNSPGYRLILNNVLYPAARKQKRKT